MLQSCILVLYKQCLKCTLIFISVIFYYCYLPYNCEFIPFDHLRPLCPAPNPTFGNHQSVLWIYGFDILWGFSPQSPHISDIVQYLCFSISLVSLCITPSSSIHVVSNVRIFSCRVLQSADSWALWAGTSLLYQSLPGGAGYLPGPHPTVLCDLYVNQWHPSSPLLPMNTRVHRFSIPYLGKLITPHVDPCDCKPPEIKRLYLTILILSFLCQLSAYESMTYPGISLKTRYTPRHLWYKAEWAQVNSLS